MSTRVRQSNMELLRIIAMAMIVMVHTDFWSLGELIADICAYEPSKAFMQYLVESIAIVGVNCFIFISGWFSIKPSVRGFANLVFQLLFYSTLIYFAFVLLGLIRFDVRSFLQHSNFLTSFWFIRIYIALYLLSPIFNTFIEHATRDTARVVILLYAFLDVVLGWGMYCIGEDGGYGLFHLGLIYLIARYIRVHGGKLFSFSKLCDLSVYALIAAITPVIVMLSFHLAPEMWFHLGKLFLYNSPFVIVASVYLSLFFTKLNFNSRVVNLVGASSFAVLLIHGDPLIMEPYLKPLCRDLFFNNSIWYYSLIMIVSIVLLFITATLVDQVRQWMWKRIQLAFIKN